MAIITTVDELFSAAGTPMTHTIAAGTYDLSTKTGGGADLVFNKSITLIPLGNVIISGAGLHRVIFTDSGADTVYSIGDPTGIFRIIYSEGDTNTCDVSATTASVTAAFHYCDFTNAVVSNGLNITPSTVGTVKVTCNNCTATGNGRDGFSINGNANTYWEYLILNNCRGYGNGLVTVGQGATAHADKQKLIINGGSYHENTAEGVSVIGPSTCLIDGAVFYGNYNGGSSSKQNLYIQDDCRAIISNCEFYGLDGTEVYYHIAAYGNAGRSNVIVENCKFYGSTGAGCDIRVRKCHCDVRGCMFSDHTTETSYAIWYYDSGDTGEVSNCTFYNYHRGIRLNSPSVAIHHNIFQKFRSLVILLEIDEECYRANPLTGNNVFYDTASAGIFHFGYAYVDHRKLSDLSVNPQLDSALRVHNRDLWDLGIGAWQPTFPTSAVGARALRNRQRVSLTEVGL